MKSNEISFMKMKSFAILCRLDWKPNVKELPKKGPKMTLGTKMYIR